MREKERERARDLFFTVLDLLVPTDRPELTGRQLEGPLTTRVVPTGPCSGNGFRRGCCWGIGVQGTSGGR